MTFSSLDPSTGNTVWTGQAASQSDVEAAVVTAKSAFDSWRVLPLKNRITHLEAFREELTRSKDVLSETISKEVGKPLWDAKTEVAAMIAKINISIEAYETRCPEMIKQQPQGTSITRHRPHGVMAVFGPFNFPGHLPNGHIVPALLAGNTIIFKPSERTPLVAELTAQCWKRSGLPDGVFNLVQGGRQTGQYLSQNNAINGLLFTGSWQTGSHLLQQFASRPEVILALEMGGNNPYIIHDVSDNKAAAYLTMQSAFLTSGQRCTCARRLIVPIGKKGDAFLATLVEMTSSITIGRYDSQPEPFMGPVISAHAAATLLQKQHQWLNCGAKALLPLAKLPHGEAFVSPGIIDVTGMTKREDEEVFGPLLQVIRVVDLQAAIKEANNTKYGLAAGLLTDSVDHYRYFHETVRAGVLSWNLPLTGASSAAPFGGIGHSGNFRPSAYYAADYCSYPIAALEKEVLAMPESLTPGINLKV